MTAIIPPQVSTACSRVMLSSRGTRAVSDFAWALSALVKSDPSLPSRVRMQERGMAMGAGLLGNRPLSKRFRELGIRGFTIRTSPEQEVLVQGLEALFNTALANDLAGVRAVLKDENVLKKNVLLVGGFLGRGGCVPAYATVLETYGDINTYFLIDHCYAGLEEEKVIKEMSCLDGLSQEEIRQAMMTLKKAPKKATRIMNFRRAVAIFESYVGKRELKTEVKPLLSGNMEFEGGK